MQESGAADITPKTTQPVTVQSLPVLRAADFCVTDGVAQGDPIAFADELVLDDIYQLGQDSTRVRLALSVSEEQTAFRIAPESEAGNPGNRLVLDCAITLMAPDSLTFEALVLVEVEDGAVAQVYLLPLVTLLPKTNYQLVGIDRDSALARFGEVACVSFTRGTHITLASGAQIPIEQLSVGDKVLTRDDGPQAIRWIGHTTLRAVGDFAPVVITKGALHNENDLIVSPDHRLFVYQRTDRLGAGRPEVLVKVRHLINGDTVRQQDGGFVEYYQLLFDEHQIIYAEGIAAESLLIDPRTRAALPAEAGAHPGGARRTHARRQHLEYEVQESLLSSPDAVDKLRRSTSSD